MNRGLMPFEDALANVLAGARAVVATESVPTLAAAGRILARSVCSAIDVPPLDNSAMDGYAVRAADVRVSGTRLAVAQRIAAGAVGHVLTPGTAARIFTGAPVPPGADAVVMQELCAASDGLVTIHHVPSAGENIRRRGEDIAAGSDVLAAGSRLGAADMGVAASVGQAQLTVFRKLRVALFSTGDELAMPGEPLKPGGIYNSNRTTLHALLSGLGCEVTDFGIVPDQLEATRTVLREASAAHDLILTSGGVSVGEEDHIKPAVEAEGELSLWKIAIKPGKPFAFGRVADASFIGLPGNPVASFVTFLMLVRPFILKSQGGLIEPPRTQTLLADFAWKGDPRREFLRARINAAGHLELFVNQGSGVLTSCAWGHGLVNNPPGVVVAPGQPVSFLPFSELL